ncbi:MAG: TolC family protein [Acidobacteria bacterium]|nr:TolC family protein [Acidobacteriota bacterium]
MMRWLAALTPVLVCAQEGLTLAEAARLAQAQHPASKAAGARVTAAGLRIEQARSGYLPKIHYTESYSRGNNPVYVFGSLLNQRRFTADDLRLDSLNHPAPVNNFQSLVAVDQTVFDAGQTKKQVQAVELETKLTAEEQRLTRMTLAAAAVRAYFGVLLAEESSKVAQEAVTAAGADLKRAEAIRAAGMSTDADVLSIQVHLAAMREQQIRRRSELEVARAALNEALGAPLDTVRRLTTSLASLPAAPAGQGEYEKKAVAERPDARSAALETQLAQAQSSQARAAYFPQVSIRGAFEADRGRLVTHGGASWFAGVTMRWNLFNGYADRSRVRESEHAVRITESQREQIHASLELQVRKAYAELAAATERIGVAEAAVAQAGESLRITRNRYLSGLSTVTDLLRNQTARMEASLRKLTAVHDQRVAATMLELAAGTLSPDSEVLR